MTSVNDTVHATLYGTFAVAVVQGTLGGLMFWWLGLPAPLLWGIVMALLAVVPVLGAFIIWIPAAIFLLLEGSEGKALLLTLWGAIVVGGIDNLLYPILVGRRLKMHTILAFISLVGGLIVFGPSGLILGPVIFTVTRLLLEIWSRQNSVETGRRPGRVNYYSYAGIVRTLAARRSVSVLALSRSACIPGTIVSGKTNKP